jgi:hypothetical protein
VAEKVYGLLIFHKEQKPLIEKHCFGDCGKVSMAGVIADDELGGLYVCSETQCPWLLKQTDEPYGNTMSFGRPHEVYLRLLTDSPSAQGAEAGGARPVGPLSKANEPNEQEGRPPLPLGEQT